MDNPFVFSKLVSKENFCTRDELQTLKSYIENSQNIVLFSKRRYGKSSLIKELFENHLNENFLCIYADIYSVNNEKDLSNILYKSIAKSIKLDMTNLLKVLKDLFSRASFSINLSNDGELEFRPNIVSKGIDESFDDIFTSLEKYAKKHNKKIIFAIDEFQEIANIDEKILALFRSYIQNLENISFIFSGSKEHLLTEIFTSPKKAFYKSSQMLELLPINKNKFFEFSKQKFGSKILEFQAFDLIYELSKGESWLVQNICYHLWQKYDKISVSEVKECVGELLCMNDSLYRSLFERFSQNSKTALKIIANDAKTLLSKENLFNFNISKPSLASAIKSLQKDEIIVKENDAYFIYDTLFSLWINKNFCQD